MVRLSETQRYEFATSIIIKAGELASSYFSDLSKLVIEKKGHQDLVSEADKNVEIFIRDQISAMFPNDNIIGEEGGASPGTGTTNSGCFIELITCEW